MLMSQRPLSVPGDLVSTMVVRFGGLPTHAVHTLASHQLSQELDRLRTLDARIGIARDTVSGILHAAVARAGDSAERNRLLRARRDLFNDRRLGARRLSELRAVLADAEYAAVSEVESVLALRESAVDEVRSLYTAALGDARPRLRGLARHPSFANGLLLSSRSLFLGLARYERTPPNALASRGEQIERGILRYLTRASMKATPFSTFCTVVRGSVTFGSARSSISVDRPLAEQRSVLRLNKTLYTRLWAALKRRQAFRRGLVVELNPTLSCGDAQWSFLASAGDREVFRRVSRNAAIDLVHRLVSQSGATFGRLIQALCTEPTVESNDDEADTYVNSLVNVGFLRFRAAVHEQEVDWDLSFCELLETIEDEAAAEVRRMLTGLREHLDAASKVDGEARARILETMQDLVATAGSAGIELPPAPRGDTIIYEDATADAQVTIRASASLEKAFATLRDVVGGLLRVSYPRGAMASMRHFFESYYTNQDAVPLLRFYEEFYREHLRDHIEKERRGRGGMPLDGYNILNPFSLEFIRKIQRAQANIADSFRRAWKAAPDAEEVSVRSASLATSLREVDEIPTCRSASVFAVIMPESADRPGRVVVPSATFYPGYGKYFSRFLYLFPDEVLHATRATNEGLTPHVLAEISGDAAFNANLHPPILETEISYPTGDAPRIGSPLTCTEIEVRRDPDDPQALMLWHVPMQKRIFPIDLGFLSATRRPPLYQLLIRFMPAGYFSIALPDTMDPPPRDGRASPPAESPAEPEVQARETDDVRYRPRMVIDDALVVARRRWSVPSSAFPVQRPNESATDYFIRVNRWRTTKGMPREIYVRIRPLPVTTRPAEQHPVNGELSPGAKPQDAAPDATMLAELANPDQPVPDDDQGSGEDAVRSESPATEAGPQQAANLRRAPEGFSRDWWKPQYIDFESPLLLKLFARLPAGLQNFVMHIEERYPDEHSLPEAYGERRTCEAILQFSFPQPRGGIVVEDMETPQPAVFAGVTDA
jgi:hypothetical protein